MFTGGRNVSSKYVFPPLASTYYIWVRIFVAQGKIWVCISAFGLGDSLCFLKSLGVNLVAMALCEQPGVWGGIWTITPDLRRGANTVSGLLSWLQAVWLTSVFLRGILCLEMTKVIFLEICIYLATPTLSCCTRDCRCGTWVFRGAARASL